MNQSQPRRRLTYGNVMSTLARILDPCRPHADRHQTARQEDGRRQAAEVEMR